MMRPSFDDTGTDGVHLQPLGCAGGMVDLDWLSRPPATTVSAPDGEEVRPRHACRDGSGGMCASSSASQFGARLGRSTRTTGMTR